MASGDGLDKFQMKVIKLERSTEEGRKWSGKWKSCSKILRLCPSGFIAFSVEIKILQK